MAKRHAPATLRNRDAILETLQPLLAPLAPGSLLLEVASGTGEHAAYLAPRLPHLVWQPSDRDPENLASIAAWAEDAAGTGLRPPLALDTTADPWPLEQADALFCANMIHIAPWEAALGLLQGAARLLPPGGPLVLYGPYHINGRATAPSNMAFDQSLRAQDPQWGVRDLTLVESAARPHGLRLASLIPMPANNFMVVFRRG